MTDDLEDRLRGVLDRHARLVDEDRITGDTVRALADPHQRRSAGWAPVAAAAAVLVTIAGLATAAIGVSDSPPRPITPGLQLTGSPTTSRGGSGPVPTCPSTDTAPAGTNTVCAIGRPPSVGPGRASVRTLRP